MLFKLNNKVEQVNEKKNINLNQLILINPKAFS